MDSILPPADLSLATGDLHAWLIPIDAPPVRVSELTALLSLDEQARAARFRFERDRTRFIAARAALRRILGRYLGRAPAELAFDYSPHGKPSLAGDP